MSRSVDLFVSSSEPIEEVARKAGVVSGLQVEAGEDGTWTLREGETVAVLGVHRFTDDAELPFGRYRYSFSARVPAEIRPQDSVAGAMLRRLAQRLDECCGWPVLLVHDLQFREALHEADPPAPPSGEAQ